MATDYDIDVWFSSDWHFGHSNILKFTRDSGDSLLRPGFQDVNEMDEFMIAQHNQYVGKNDKFYTLGDVSFSKKDFPAIASRLNGHKRLILGNHDKFGMDFYLKYFPKILVEWRPIRGLIFSHRPLYLGGENLLNVHGHIHAGQIDDPRYFNISVEETGYKPIHFNEIIEVFRKRGYNI